MITTEQNQGKVYDTNVSIYHPDFINFEKEPMFLGTGKNMQRFDNPKIEEFAKLDEFMQGLNWTFNEIKCHKDRDDFVTLPECMQHIFTVTLQKLIFLDSLMGRGIVQILGPIVSLPELEALINTWQYQEENEHSRSYTEQLRAIYPNPGEIFDGSFQIPELMSLVKSITEPYNECFELVTEYTYMTQRGMEYSEEKMDKLKESIIMYLVTINILEGVRFYSGFASIWAMHYGSGKMHRSSKLLQLICRDENMHLKCSQLILKRLREDESEGFKHIYERIRDKIRQKYETAYNEEIYWIDFMFKYGSYIGMNKEILIQYMKYNINKRLRAIDEPIMFKGFDKNPIKWVESYISMDSVEVSLAA